MNARQKTTIAVTALCLLAVIAVVAIIAVFAASQQTFTSNINVSYTVEDVMAKVSAKYYGGKNDATLAGKDMTTTGAAGGESEITFNAGEGAKDAATLSPQGEIVLDATNKFVVFEYKFENIGPRDFNASMAFTGTLMKNVKVYVESSVVTTPVTTPIETTHFNDGTKFTQEASVTGEAETSKTFNIEATKVDGTDTGTNKTVYIYVKVAVEDIGTDAAFNGSFTWTLKAVDKAA